MYSFFCYRIYRIRLDICCWFDDGLCCDVGDKRLAKWRVWNIVAASKIFNKKNQFIFFFSQFLFYHQFLIMLDMLELVHHVLNILRIDFYHLVMQHVYSIVQLKVLFKLKWSFERRKNKNKYHSLSLVELFHPHKFHSHPLTFAL